MDIRLNYEEKGEGEALIFLHGNGENLEYFSAQTEYFSKFFRTIAIDTRGHGKSPRGEKPFTIRQFADDLAEFMDEMKIERANILGFSDGGNIALVFAIKYPQRVDKLILNGANLHPDGVKKTIQLPIEAGYRIAKLLGNREKAELLRLMVNDPFIDEADLCRVKAKTLVIAGDKDMIKEEHTRRIASLIPGAELCIIEGDHFIANKRPVEFNQKTKEFLCGKKGKA